MTTSNLLIYPSTLRNPTLNPAFIQLAYYQRDDTARTTPLATICLKMPDKISQPSTVNWGEEAFGMASSVIKDGLKNFMGNGDNGMSVDEMLSSVGSRVAQQATFNVIAGATKAVGGNASAAGLMGEVIGKTPNPFMTVIFRGIDFRKFSFTFIFTPLSESDCELIDEIIKVMRANANAEYVDDRAFLAYPSECQISYYWKGQPHKWLNRFKRAACTAISVDYTGTGSYQSMRNAFPTQIVVDTTWQELEIVTRSDITQGGF